MATYQYCDHFTHEGEDGQFTPAVCIVRVTTLDNNTIESVARADSCREHLGTTVEQMWVRAAETPHFHQIVVMQYGQAGAKYGEAE